MNCPECKIEMHLAERSEDGDPFSISVKWAHKPKWINACVRGVDSLTCDDCMREVAADPVAQKEAIAALKDRISKLAEPPPGFTYDLFAEKKGAKWEVLVATNKPYSEVYSAEVLSEMIRAGLVAAQGQGFDSTPEIRLLQRIKILLRMKEIDAAEIVQLSQRKLVRKVLRVLDKNF